MGMGDRLVDDQRNEYILSMYKEYLSVSRYLYIMSYELEDQFTRVTSYLMDGMREHQRILNESILGMYPDFFKEQNTEMAFMRDKIAEEYEKLESIDKNILTDTEYE